MHRHHDPEMEAKMAGAERARDALARVEGRANASLNSLLEANRDAVRAQHELLNEVIAQGNPSLLARAGVSAMARDLAEAGAASTDAEKELANDSLRRHILIQGE